MKAVGQNPSNCDGRVDTNHDICGILENLDWKIRSENKHTEIFAKDIRALYTKMKA